ncbi:MAG: hypothetical protein CEE43_08610 [Promethearchaeota archaeon Loki_b32]|nr:MAG: hypothetical protein CEE43_08610 [Candidatus Lokiarchaeota archaeon Loki_b32]
MLFDYWDVIRGFFDWVAQSAAIMMVLSGAMAITWLGFERKRRGSFKKRKVEEEAEFNVTKFLRGMSYLGLILGVFVIWSGVMSLILDIPPSFQYRDVTENHANHFTSIFLIVIGITMAFKPISDLPLSSIIGLLASTATAIIITLIVPDTAVQEIGNFINPKWILVIIFIIVAVVVGLTAKFYIGTLQKISKFLSWPPIAFVIMIFCFVQGLALWIWGVSIFGLNLL